MTSDSRVNATHRVVSDVEETPSYDVVDFDIKIMKEELEASKTMSDEEFEKYLILNYPLVYTSGTRRFVVDINPLVVFEENDETELRKSIQTDSFSADIFLSDIWNSYTGNIYYDGEIYTFRVYEMYNIELVESELHRLSFVKIGDLLNE